MITTDATPGQITAGDAYQWTIDNAGYPMSSYSFSYGLLSDNGLTNITISQNGEENGFPKFTLNSKDSSAYVPGTYYYQLYATDSDSNRFKIGQGQFLVLPDFSKPQPKSQDRRTYEAICDLLEGRANDDINSTSINGKSIVSMPTSALTDLRSYYAGLVDKEKNALRMQSGLKSNRVIRVRFNPVGGTGFYGGRNGR